MNHEEFWDWAANNREEFTRQYEDAMGGTGTSAILDKAESIALEAAAWLMGQTSKECERMVRGRFAELRKEVE